MYKCGNCDTVYDLTDEHYSYIGKECKDNVICETICVCPGCGKERIVGGGADWDEIDEQEIVMMFGHDIYDSDDVSKLKVFRGKIHE